MDSLSSAIIVFPSDWQDAVPQLLLKNVTLARLLTQGERNALTASIHVKNAANCLLTALITIH